MNPEMVKAMQRKLMRAAARLAIAQVTGELVVHRQAQYDSQLHTCKKLCPEWAYWFQHGGAYPA